MLLKNHGLAAQFRQTLKNPAAEELLDLGLYRPLAFLLVKILALFPVTPNQISVMSMLCGIASGIILAGGTCTHWIIGGLMFALANVLDCCDGMIARFKHNGTRTGRIVDGLVDYVTNAAAYIGFAIGASKAVAAGTMHLPFNAWLLMAVAGVSTVFHSIASDYYRNTFINQSKRTGASARSEYEEFVEERDRLAQLSGHTADKALVGIYLWYLALQSKKNVQQAASSSPAVRKNVSTLSVFLWNLIGPTTHISSLVLAAVLFQPMVFFIYVVVVANFWLLFLLVVQPLLNRPTS